LSHYLKQ